MASSDLRVECSEDVGEGGREIFIVAQSGEGRVMTDWAAKPRGSRDSAPSLRQALGPAYT